MDVALEMSKEMSGRLLIKVSDTGVGIRDEDKERIFGTFLSGGAGRTGTPVNG